MVKSDFLAAIFAEAEKIMRENNKDTMVADYVLRAIVRFMSDNASSDWESTDEYLKVKKYIKDFGLDSAVDNIDSHMSKITFGDVLIWREIMNDATGKAKSNGNVMTADILLLCILADDSVRSRVCDPKGKNSDNSAKDYTSGSDLGSIFKWGKTPEEPKKEERKPEQKPAPVEEKPDFSDVDKNIDFLSNLSTRCKALQEELLNTVFGQENAVNTFVQGYFDSQIMYMLKNERKKPLATFLFAGPPGVGKTYLAETAANSKFMNLPYRRFNMSDYAEHDTAGNFIGNDPKFVGAAQGQLTAFVKENPRSIIVFDEIEKAYSGILHYFLQILDAGELFDQNIRETVSFKDTILIFTTNVGRSLYEDTDVTNFSNVPVPVIVKALTDEVNPRTNEPYFPTAICSRLSSGYITLFNHMDAHILRRLAMKEIKKQADSIKEKLGIDTHVDDSLYSAILFAEGGKPDARVLTSKASKFYSSELYEFMRLVTTTNHKISDIKNINLTIEIPDAKTKPDIAKLYRNAERPGILVIGNEKVIKHITDDNTKAKFYTASTLKKAEEMLGKYDINIIFCDYMFGVKKHSDFLNIEDVESTGRDCFNMAVSSYDDIPMYIIQTSDHKYKVEEIYSLQSKGARDLISIDYNDSSVFNNRLDELAFMLHQQACITELAKTNRVLKYETAQVISDDGHTAEIRVFDMKLETAVSGEDSKSVLSDVEKPDVRFDDVIASKETVDELQSFISFLKNPKKYMENGQKAPKGMLLYGPPGTGKTMLAKALASEAGVTFLSTTGSSFFGNYVGDEQKNVKRLFATARRYAPSIIFIDEIDTILKSREGLTGDGGGHAAQEGLTQLLAEMDGFKTNAKKPVFVLGATNFDPDSRVLDRAALRRFDRRIYVGLPDKEGREKYMRMMMKKLQTLNISDEMLNNILERSTGMSIAELEAIINQAQREAQRQGQDKINDAVFDEAFETFISGEERSWSPKELENTARHEVGHALIMWLSGENPSYITITARGNHGGYVRHEAREDKGTYNVEELRSLIRISLAGRAAELVYNGDTEGLTTGPSSDLEHATHLATDIVCRYGMCKEFGMSVVDMANASDSVSAEVRKAVNMILDEELQNAIDLIRDNKKAIDAMVEILKVRTHLNTEEINRVFTDAGARR